MEDAQPSETPDIPQQTTALNCISHDFRLSDPKTDAGEVTPREI